MGDIRQFTGTLTRPTDHSAMGSSAALAPLFMTTTTRSPRAECCATSPANAWMRDTTSPNVKLLLPETSAALFLKAAAAWATKSTTPPTRAAACGSPVCRAEEGGGGHEGVSGGRNR